MSPCLRYWRSRTGQESRAHPVHDYHIVIYDKRSILRQCRHVQGWVAHRSWMQSRELGVYGIAIEVCRRLVAIDQMLLDVWRQATELA